jgi:hypothetical protein
MTRRRRPQIGHRGAKQHDFADRRLRDFRPLPPVDGRIGQMRQQVEHARAVASSGETVEMLGDFRPDAGQRRCGGEERSQNMRAHGGFLNMNAPFAAGGGKLLPRMNFPQTVGRRTKKKSDQPHYDSAGGPS